MTEVRSSGDPAHVPAVAPSVYQAERDSAFYVACSQGLDDTDADQQVSPSTLPSKKILNKRTFFYVSVATRVSRCDPSRRWTCSRRCRSKRASSAATPSTRSTWNASAPASTTPTPDQFHNPFQDRALGFRIDPAQGSPLIDCLLHVPVAVLERYRKRR